MRVILLILILCFIGCEKEDPIECWTCTETWIRSSDNKGSRTFEVCDVLEAAELNGKKETKIEYHSGGTHTRINYLTTCK